MVNRPLLRNRYVPLQVYKHQAKLATPIPGDMHVRSFWDSLSMPGGVSLHDSATVTFSGLKGHKGASSKLGLTRGKWTWRLRVESIGRKYAWAGATPSPVSEQQQQALKDRRLGVC